MHFFCAYITGYHNNPVTRFLRNILGYTCLIPISCPLVITAEPLGYQQIAVINASGGYGDKRAFFLDQRGVLSTGPNQLSYRVQCHRDHCDWQSAKLSYLPRTYQLALGYDRRFQSHVLARQQPFFGFMIGNPNHMAIYPKRLPAWQPWLGLVIPRSGMLQLKDPSGTLQQNTLTAGSHLLESSDLPIGAYPVDLSLTDQNGHTETLQQFVNNTDLSQTYAHSATRLIVGFPTDQAAASAYGLPPINADIRELMLNLMHRFHTRFGTTQTTLNIQKQQLALGINTLFTVGSAYWQPDFLWQHGLSSTATRQSMALGFNAQGLFSPQTQWRLLATTYPKKQTNNDLPWVAHGQIQWLYAHWLAGLTGHLTDRHSNRYVQALMRRQFSHPRYHPILSLSTRVFEQGNPTFSLMLTAKEKTPVAWASRLTNRQQSITASVKPSAHSRLGLSMINVSSTQSDNQRLSASLAWQDAFARWRATGSLPLHDQHATWSIQAKTGMICSPQASVWTPLTSITTPAIIDMQASPSNSLVYWGDRAALCQSGISLLKKRPYSLVPKKISADTPMLYPSNVITITPPPQRT